MPTIAEKLIEQGMTKGIQQGTLQMARGNIIEILEVRFDAVTKSVLKILIGDR